MIAPLETTPPLDPGVAAVLLIDPDANPDIDEAGLRSLYGLTRAEANLVSILARGRTLEEAADELCVSLSTVEDAPPASVSEDRYRAAGAAASRAYCSATCSSISAVAAIH